MTLVIDDAEWAEKKHPRGKGGQFAIVAKKGQVSPSASIPLLAHGFKMKPGGEAKYEHPAGHEIHIKPLPEGTKFYTSGWYDPASGKEGTGGVALKQHFASLGLAQQHQIGTPTKPKAPKAGKPPPYFQHPAATYAKAIGEHGGVPVKETETLQTYKFPNGTMLAIKKKPPKSAWGSSYVKWAMTTPSGELIKYKGVGGLQNTLAKHEGAVAQPAPASVAEKTGPKLEAAGFVKESGTKQAGGESYSSYYQKHDSGGKLQESVAFKENGDFRLWSAGTKLAEEYPLLAKAAGTGYAVTGSADQFDTVFEALHPRGPGGQFAAKPGGEVGGPVLKDEGIAASLKLFGAKFKETGGTGAWASHTYEVPGTDVTVRLINEANPNFGVFKNGVPVGTGSEKGSVDLVGTLLKAGLSPTGAVPPAPSAPIAKPPISTKSLEKVGPQLGSNPGGQYQDAAGQKFYVKQTQSEDHARNENLAASLYALAGAGTLPYRKAEDDPKAVVTEMIPLGINNVSGLSPLQRKAAQEDFAAHAWLANWDAVGLSGDNIGVAATGPGRPINLDLGGALAYRAKGGPKGALFGNSVDEWTSLRDSGKNPQSAALFGSMTPEELKASAARVGAVTPYQIGEAVKAAGYTGPEGGALINKLLARREDIVKRAQQAKPAPPEVKHQMGVGTVVTGHSGKSFVVDPAQPNKISDQIYNELNSERPPPTNKQHAALDGYKGNGYHTINDCMRYLENCDHLPAVKEIRDYLAEARTNRDLTVFRGMRSEYMNKLKGVIGTAAGAKAQAIVQDSGFISTSTSYGVSLGFADGDPNNMFVIELPKGSHGTAVNNVGEQEILLQQGTRFILTGEKDPLTGCWKARVDQTHMIETSKQAAAT